MPDQPAVHELDETLFFVELSLKKVFQCGNHSSIIPAHPDTAVFSKINPPLIGIVKNGFARGTERRKPLLDLADRVSKKWVVSTNKMSISGQKPVLTAPVREIFGKLDDRHFERKGMPVDFRWPGPGFDIHTNAFGPGQSTNTFENKRGFSPATPSSMISPAAGLSIRRTIPANDR